MRNRLRLLSLVVLILLPAAPRTMAGFVILPSVQQVTLAPIAPGGQTSYSFNQRVGPLAFDFARADDRYGMTTANYLFNGSVTKSSETGSFNVPLFAQWSPGANASGVFVPFLGNDQNGCPSHTTVGPTTVAAITDAAGNQYGYIQAQFTPSSPSDDVRHLDKDDRSNNTTFTFVNTSHDTIDPTLSGEQIGVSLAENFTGSPSTPTTSGTGGSISSGTPTENQGGGGFSIPNITASTNTGTPNTPITLTLSSSQSFTAINSFALNTLSMSSGTVTISDNAPLTYQGPRGGFGFITASASISQGSTPIETLSFQDVGFNVSESPTFPISIPFGSQTAQQELAGLQLNGTYTVTLAWKIQFTPNDPYATVSADPNIVFSSSSPNVSTPAPPTLVLSAIGAVCLAGFHWLGRRTSRERLCPVTA